MRALDQPGIFYLISGLCMLFLWFFKRSWLEEKPAKSVVAKLCLFSAAIGACGWFASPARLEFLMLLFPLMQFHAYGYMFTVFERRYHRSPVLPSLANTGGAKAPDQVFNFLFMSIALFIPFIGGGIILMKLAGNI